MDNENDNRSKAERAAHYRHMALDALKHAEQTKDERRRESYVHLARSWHVMAVQVEQSELPALIELESARLRAVDSALSGGMLKH